MDETSALEFSDSIRVIERKLDRQFSSGDCCCGITVPECHMLMALHQKGGMTIKQLSLFLDLDKSTVSRTADGLFKSGLIERLENPEDRRYTDLRLTGKGFKLTDEINGIWNNIYDEIFLNIPGDKHSIVIESFKLFAGALRKSGIRRL